MKTAAKPTALPRDYPSVEALARSMASWPKYRGGKLTRCVYTDHYEILRTDFPDHREKIIRPVHCIGDVWRFGDPEGPLPLFHVDLAIKAIESPVCVFEGESCVLAAESIGLVAVTSSHGCKSPGRTDWTPLRGRTVWIFPDNDRPGREYAEHVTEILLGLGCTACVVVLPDLPPGGDIVDYIKAHDSTESEDLRRMVEAVAAETPMEQPPEPNAPAATWRPFPVDALPEPIRRFIEQGATAIGCDPSMIALPVLAVLCGAVGSTRRIRLKRSWVEPSILWTAIIARSGSLKSPACELACKPLQNAQAQRLQEYAGQLEEYDAEKLEREKELQQWKRDTETTDPPPKKPQEPAAVRYLVQDATIESLAPILSDNRRGLILIRDELSGWIGSFNQYKSGGKGADLANWLELHRCGTITIDRKGGIRLIHVPRAAVSITGTIQPGAVEKILTAELFDSGLVARLLVAQPPIRKKRWREADLPEQTERRYADVIASLLDLSHEVGDFDELLPIALELSPGAKAAWIQFYEQFAREQAESDGDRVASVLAKIEGAVGRLALIIQLVSEPQATTVDLESIQAAIRIGQWFAAETRRVYSTWDLTDEEREQSTLLTWIQEHGGKCTVRDMRRGPRIYRNDAARAQADLEGLAANGLVTIDVAGVATVVAASPSPPPT